MIWDRYEKAAEKGPVWFAIKVAGAILGFFVVVAPVSYLLGWCGDAASVIREEFGPREALRKYEWFKDAAAQLEKKIADVSVYRSRMSSMESDYEGMKRGAWPRSDREQYNVWASEVAGVEASYNTLSAEYNAQMAKFNWRFANSGDLPRGAADPIPREFKPYRNGE